MRREEGRLRWKEHRHTSTHTNTCQRQEDEGRVDVQASAVACVRASGKDAAQYVCITTIFLECPRLS